MNTLILFSILITFQTPDWNQTDGIYYKELNGIFTLCQYIEGTGYVFSVDIADLGFADALDVASELRFLGKPDEDKGNIVWGFGHMKWTYGEIKIIFFFNQDRFWVEVRK